MAAETEANIQIEKAKDLNRVFVPRTPMASETNISITSGPIMVEPNPAINRIPMDMKQSRLR